jgi:hypothetical protein
MMFSVTVKLWTSLKCWWTMPMPELVGALGPEIRTSWPRTLMVPESGW